MHHTAVGWSRWNTLQEQNGSSDGWEWFLSEEIPEAGKGILVLCYTERLANTAITFIHNIYKNACYS